MTQDYWDSDEGKAFLEARNELAGELLAKDPSLGVAAIIMAGDIRSADRAKKALAAGEHPFGGEYTGALPPFEAALVTVGSYGRLDFTVWALENGYTDEKTVFMDLPEIWRGSDPDDTDPRFKDLWRRAFLWNGGKYLRDGKALPRGPLTLYRGQDPLAADETPGIAWSLERDVAVRFARGAALRQSGRKGVVLVTTVPRKCAWGYMTGRSEAEVIIDPACATEIEIQDI